MPTYDEKKSPPYDRKWWPPIQPCESRSRLKDEGSQDLDVEKEITIYNMENPSWFDWRMTHFPQLSLVRRLEEGHWLGEEENRRICCTFISQGQDIHLLEVESSLKGLQKLSFHLKLWCFLVWEQWMRHN